MRDSSASGISSPMHAMQKFLANSSCVVSVGLPADVIRDVRIDRHTSSPVVTIATGSLAGRYRMLPLPMKASKNTSASAFETFGILSPRYDQYTAEGSPAV